MNGVIAENEAIAWFTRKGYLVSYPLGRPSHYDLIVDCGGHIETVEVKSSRNKAKSGGYKVQLRTMGGRGSGERKRINDFYTDLLFVYTPEDNYLIPAEVISKYATICVGGRKYNQFSLEK